MSGGRKDGDALGGERRNGSESDLEITDAAWDEARREQASRAYINFIMSRSPQAMLQSCPYSTITEGQLVYPLLISWVGLSVSAGAGRWLGRVLCC